MKSPWKIDVAVLLIFFVRDKTLEQVFDSIREAKPRTLLLWQDGPREGRDDDVQGILRCRKIVENIDWECTVYTQYNEKNYGCDPSTFYAHKWAFSLVDKCIVMEDDRIPSQSFYTYCKELLDKYENDERINHICGTNLLGVYEDCPEDYFFAPCGSTTWATWRRVAESWDEEYLFLDDKYKLECLKRLYGEKWFDVWHKNAVRHKNTGVPYWETILGIDALLNSRLAIIPKRNMICDIGLTENATHANPHSMCLPKEYRNMFNMKVYDVQFPLNAPKHVVADMNYMHRLTLINGIGHPFIRFKRKMVYFLKCIRYGKFDLIFAGIKRKMKR